MSISLEAGTVLTLNNCLLNKQRRFNKVFLEKNPVTKENYVEISGFHDSYKERATFICFLFIEINNMNKINCRSSQVLAF